MKEVLLLLSSWALKGTLEVTLCSQFDNFYEMDQSHEIQKLPKLKQENIDNLHNTISSNRINNGELPQTFKVIPILYTLFQKI